MKIKSRLILIAIIAILVAAGAVFFWLNRDTTPRPKILIIPMVWDLGQVIEGNKYTNTFKICNEGDTLLKIASARPSCTCDTVTLSTDEVAPHGCSIMQVIFDTKDRVGAVEAWVYVQSNDPRQQLVQIKIFAKVAPKK